VQHVADELPGLTGLLGVAYLTLHPAVTADLLRRLGRADEARTEYERALEPAPTEPERRFLRRRMADVSA